MSSKSKLLDHRIRKILKALLLYDRAQKLNERRRRPT
jgi:hypothetical protein